MKLYKANDVWAVESSYHERTIPKAAGFWWHPGTKCARPRCQACAAGVGAQWWTRDRVVAAKLSSYAGGDVREDLDGVKVAQEASRALDAPADIVIPVPPGLAYYPFQKASIAYALSRPNVLLAEEPGLGKTAEVMGVINADPTIKTVLAIVPATLRINWRREAERWLVRPMKTQVIEGREMPDEDAEFVIVNYDKLTGKRGENLFNYLMTLQFDLLVVDEAHYVKEPTAQRTKRILGYHDREEKKDHPGVVSVARRIHLLTGTPIPNKPIEIFGLVHALAPKEFPEFFKFALEFCGAYKGKYGWDFTGATNLDKLQAKLRGSCMTRHLKKDVLLELPDKRHQLIVLPPDGALKEIKAEEEAFKKTEDDLFEAQATVDLAHAAGNEAAYKEAVKKLKKVQGIALSAMSKVRHDTAVAKIPAVLEHMDNLFEEGLSKAILWAHHHDVVHAIAEHYGDACVVITGETPQADRQPIVDRFQSDPSVKLFIGGITAAGVGITLTAASHVVFAELDWVPGNVKQATDRCHRIGQKESVLVQYLVFDKSLDAKMAARLIEKQEVMDKALDLPLERDLLAPGATLRPRKYPIATPVQRAAALEGLQRLAGVCDYAGAQDTVGFNKIDARIGHNLAALRTLTDGQVWLAKRILPKYHGQLGAELVGRLG